MNFLVNKHVHAEPKKTNKKQLEKAMGCKQIPKKINSENPLMSTVKLIHVNLKKKYWIWQTIYLLNQLLGNIVIKYNDNNEHHKETQ